MKDVALFVLATLATATAVIRTWWMWRDRRKS